MPILSELDWILQIMFYSMMDVCYDEDIKSQRLGKAVFVNTLFSVVKIILLLATELPKDPLDHPKGTMGIYYRISKSLDALCCPTSAL